MKGSGSTVFQQASETMRKPDDPHGEHHYKLFHAVPNLTQRRLKTTHRIAGRHPQARPVESRSTAPTRDAHRIA
jgi:hypothetical protein